MQVQTEYTSAMSRKYPEAVVVAIARDSLGKCNPITLGWCMPTSHVPPMLAISVGVTRYSLDVIRHAREFVISFPSSRMVDEVLYYGTTSGREIDKFGKSPLLTENASEIDCVIITDAVSNFECRLESEHPTGDHVIFVGRVVASHANEDPEVERLYKLEKALTLGGVAKLS